MKQEELEMAASICAVKTLGRNEGKKNAAVKARAMYYCCLLYTSPSPRDRG